MCNNNNNNNIMIIIIIIYLLNKYKKYKIKINKTVLKTKV